MHIKRLRLVGFKSFVEPTDLLIERGLTGVVGPNGCGKSNLLEALRWVMGETSHKSMRAAAMDDVIFSGTQGRPARNSAEVMILLDNADRKAPAELNGSDTIEVIRHIEREAGSIYRVNGRDVRARDVKLLFEDAATGARSPALVRQGQIGEIVNAKPEQRRRILEDAAGIAGLHSRRHEAELRLKAAEGNLARLGDVLGQLSSQMGNLKRQARQAKRYKEISAEMRQVEAIALHLAWQAAQGLVEAEEAALLEALKIVGLATEAEAAAIRLEAEAAGHIPALREEEARRGAILHRLRHEAEVLEQEEARARDRHTELETRLAQLAKDRERESDIAGEAEAASARLAEEAARLHSEPGADPAAEEQARAVHAVAIAVRTSAEETLNTLTARLADERANRRRIEALTAEEERQTARLAQQLMEVDRLLAALPPGPDPAELDRLATGLAEIEAAIGRLEAGTIAAEQAALKAGTAEAEASSASARVRLEVERLATELQTIRRLASPAAGDGYPLLVDKLRVTRGFETALGAALGEDLDAALSHEAPVHWVELASDGNDPPLPAGCRPLAEVVKGPAETRRRLAQIGVVEAEQGPVLHAALRPGQVLVTRDGHVWRWDGLVSAADAPTPAALRLAQRNRLEQLETDEVTARNRLEAADAALALARQAKTAAAEGERKLRSDWRARQAARDAARETVQRAERLTRETEAKRLALEEGRKRHQEAHAEHQVRRSVLKDELAGLPDMGAIEGELEQARIQTAGAREAVAGAQAAVVGLERDRMRREARLKAIAEETERCRLRAGGACDHLKSLDARMRECEARIAELAGIPGEIAAKRARLLDALQQREAERTEAADALAAAETRLREAVARLREVQGELNGARENRARTEVRLEGARERRSAEARRIREVLDCAPEGCLALAGLELSAELPSLPDIERRLQRLREDRERLGGVNLAADEELEALTKQFESMDSERMDLEQAIASLRQGIAKLNREGRVRLARAFEEVNGHFQRLFTTLFGGGEARLELIEAEDPLEGGLEIIAKPPGKKPATLSLLSGGEQTLTALSLIFAVFLTNPSPICVLDEVDAPLDDSNVERFCTLMDEMARTTDTRFLVITHHPMTMSRMHRLYGVTMVERGVSQLVSVDLATAERYREAG